MADENRLIDVPCDPRCRGLENEGKQRVNKRCQPREDKPETDRGSETHVLAIALACFCRMRGK